MTSAAAGSAHHQPSQVLKPTPRRVAAEVKAQKAMISVNHAGINRQTVLWPGHQSREADLRYRVSAIRWTSRVPPVDLACTWVRGREASSCGIRQTSRCVQPSVGASPGVPTDPDD